MAHKAREFLYQSFGNDPAINSSPGLSGGYLGRSGNWRGAMETNITELFESGRLPASEEDLGELVEGAMQRLPANGDMAMSVSGLLVLQWPSGGGVRRPAPA